MPITQTNRNQEWRDGVLVADEPVEVDVTAECVLLDVHGKLRDALRENRDFIRNDKTSAQLRKLTRQVNDLIRLVIGSDLLADETDT